MREYINGRLYVNGYATDDAGRPRTMTNGYSYEDEKDAHDDYLWAKENEFKNNVLEEDFIEEEKGFVKEEKVLVENNFNQDKNKKSEKISTKKQLSSKNIIKKTTYQISENEVWDVEYINDKMFIGGYATNEMGQPICFETGYTDEDVLVSQQIYREAVKHKNDIKVPYTGLCF